MEEKWWRVTPALDVIVAAAGKLTEFERKLVVCQWINDRKVRVRIITANLVVLDGRPSFRIQPGDLDWQKSRPLKTWQDHGYPAIAKVRPQSTEAATTEVLLGDFTQTKIIIEAEEQPKDQSAPSDLWFEVNAGDVRRSIEKSVHRFATKRFLRVGDFLGLLIYPERTLFGLIDSEDLRIGAIRYRRPKALAALKALWSHQLTIADHQIQRDAFYWVGKTVL